MTADKLASLIVNKIVDDLVCRDGLGDVWKSLDRETELKIKAQWRKLAKDRITYYHTCNWRG